MIGVVSGNVKTLQSSIDEIINVLTSINSSFSNPVVELDKVISQLKTISVSLREKQFSEIHFRFSIL